LTRRGRKHFVIDGGVRNAEKGRVEGGNMAADSYLDPEDARARK
jgi:hypothetical protein